VIAAARLHARIGAVFPAVSPAEFLRERRESAWSRAPGPFRSCKGARRASGFDLTPETKAGLKWRPTETTARETLEWWRTLPAERQAAIKTGFTPERGEGATRALARAGQWVAS
jgi:2'-hydroxyisoflavone reductase